ncbi:MAG: transcription-repair coupling factor [Plesiomonas sp.]|uniref:transcription-repair coupling factor n=1 Tax=Plesiomonas sp. TaxID=2486279 RepID=UPI003F393051
MTQHNYLNLHLPVKAGDHRYVGQLVGSSLALAAAEIGQQHNGPILLVTKDSQTALRLTQEIRQFSEHTPALFPDWETLPYDSFSPHQDIISERLSTLYRLPQMRSGMLVMPVNTLMQRVCPRDFLLSHALLVKKGDQLSLEKLRAQLEQAGYRPAEQVMEHGEFATRGALLDLFPMGSLTPFRLDFFDDEIDSIRTFDPDSQRTLNEVTHINLLPAREFPTDKTAIEGFRSRWREQFEIRRDPEHVYQQVSKNTLPAGIEYWQPLFFEQMTTLFDHLPDNILIVTVGDTAEAATRFYADATKRHHDRGIDPMRPLLDPSVLWQRVDELNGHLKQYPNVHLQQAPLDLRAGRENLPLTALPEIKLQHQHKEPLQALRHFLENFTGAVVFSVESEGRRETLLDLLSPLKLRPKTIHHLHEIRDTRKPEPVLMVGSAETGFILNTGNTAQSDKDITTYDAAVQPLLALICESDLLGVRISQRRRDNRKTINTETIIRNLAELRIGQPVVHLEHGVGRYGGLTTLETGGITAEYMVLTYAGEAKLYVPVSSLHLIGRYSGGADETAPLHKLGGEAWAKARGKAAEKVRDVAAELLDIYARRALKPGFAFKHDREQYQQFCSTFPFDETEDQRNAINAVLTDMTQPYAMDRLVCGDVGFGKTEVAMRAAFLSVINHRQVAILVPTTLLAQQHFENFRDRFANWPVNIEVMSRFRSAKEQQAIQQNVTEGKVDILIGTHKLLQNDIKFSNLGLLIVDEEHRFGVRQKEKIKALRADVDILTLTATPIPRTLNMAMSGMRDLSIIATPPARRMAVKTFVREYDDLTIREAILREVLRGGQVYYLHNAVDSIEKTAEKLAELVPEARITIGHGQMRERDLERVMSDFYHQRFNVLVCTTIIETGIDIPTANTIIIDDADHFGLAQLHQLRGRVGRSHHQAYAYLLTPPPKRMTDDARKRLEAIASLEDLGAGFALATHDLEIRGAGELLGDDQSGQIESIGFTLYMEMLESAVDALRNGKEPSLDDLTRGQTEVELRIPALLPDDYLPDVNMRLSLYKRIASAENEAVLDDLKSEIIDRFGLLPDPARHLLSVARIRLRAHRLGIKRVEASDSGGYIEFNEQPNISPVYLISLLQQPQQFRLDGPTRLRFFAELLDRKKRIEYIEQLIGNFETHKITQ